MKKVFLMGRSEAGKTSLTQALKGEELHYHKIATEITVITQGRVKMNGVEYIKGDIIVMEPGESTDFECLEDGTQNVVVKIPGVNNDKYLKY